MKIEIEARFLRINPETIRAKLAALGAVNVRPNTLMRRKNLDFPDGRLNKVNGWIRIRDEGSSVTLTYKQLNDRSITGTSESEVVVNSFEDAEQFLNAIGIGATSYQETTRESWEHKGVQIEIDQWPWIEPQVEIEGPSEELVKEVASDLGLKWNDALHGSVEVAYTDAFNISEEQFYEIKTMKLDAEPPEWLAKLKK